jgi:hypothetical protein
MYLLLTPSTTETKGKASPTQGSEDQAPTTPNTPEAKRKTFPLLCQKHSKRREKGGNKESWSDGEEGRVRPLA